MSNSRQQMLKGVQFLLRNCGGLGRLLLKKLLPNNNYLVGKVGTNKAQMLHRKQLRQFTHRQPLPDVQITPQEWKPNPEVIIEHDDLFARAWECEYERPFFDADDINTAPPDPPENAVRSDYLPPKEMLNTPGTSENS